jgi:hypothetical protein
MRPFSVTLSLWLVLILTLRNILRFWTSLEWEQVLTEFSATLSPVASAVIGGVWAMVGLILWWGMRQRKAWAGKMLLGAGTGYFVWFWCERFFFQNPRPNAWFAVIVQLGILIIIFLASKSMLREAYERTTENPKTE